MIIPTRMKMVMGSRAAPAANAPQPGTCYLEVEEVAQRHPGGTEEQLGQVGAGQFGV